MTTREFIHYLAHSFSKNLVTVTVQWVHTIFYIQWCNQLSNLYWRRQMLNVIWCHPRQIWLLLCSSYHQCISQFRQFRAIHFWKNVNQNWLQYILHDYAQQLTKFGSPMQLTEPEMSMNKVPLHSKKYDKNWCYRCGRLSWLMSAFERTLK